MRTTSSVRDTCNFPGPSTSIETQQPITTGSGNYDW